MAVDEGGSTLLATSGDGSLTAVDLKQRKLLQRSDTNESELLSLAIVKVDLVWHSPLPAARHLHYEGLVVCVHGGWILRSLLPPKSGSVEMS